MQRRTAVVEGAAPGGVDPSPFDLDRLDRGPQRGHRWEHRPEVREHGVDQPGPRDVVQRRHRRRRHGRPFDGQPRGIPRQVEVAAVVVLDVPERADANHGTRHGHRTGRAHEERSPEAVRPGRRRRQAAGGVDDEPSIPQRVHDAVVGAVEALAGVHVHRGVEPALGPPDRGHAHAPPAFDPWLSGDGLDQAIGDPDRRHRALRHAEPGHDLRRVAQGARARTRTAGGPTPRVAGHR